MKLYVRYPASGMPPGKPFPELTGGGPGELLEAARKMCLIHKSKLVGNLLAGEFPGLHQLTRAVHEA